MNAKPPSQDSKIKNSKHLLRELAEQRGLAGQLHGDPANSLGDRYQVRRQLDEAARQKNLETIIGQAHELCGTEVAGEPDPDWLSHFLDLAENIRHPAMQQFWARILAREIGRPGRCSVQSLTCLRRMTQKDALLLQRAGALGCHFGDDNLRLITGFRQKGLWQGLRQQKLNPGKYRLPYAGLMQLFELGLLHQTELESGELVASTPLTLVLAGRRLQLSPRRRGVRLLYHRFTATGNELAGLMTEVTPKEYVTDLMELLAPLGQLEQAGGEA
ncbi:TIGR03899 family protein [Oceanimonas doudoroffii]|uniref:TIGR03899 family protein n=1 Tax=Oceanimonas doudoroffii TaxID=84158 RepID=A0A233RAT4_9GAMM|nr:TIGR03899 family protein [Oceanimonas doudoroffii]OXY80501.1 TIGR03899 family protein [Oceanimonas doudoroffii]